jgi:hypothetical protein
MSRTADLYVNRMGKVFVVAPSEKGRLGHIADTRKVALERHSEPKPSLCRWIFADIPKGTLTDEWGNAYDHQVHFLLAGTVAEGEELVQALVQEGFHVQDAPDLFVPFQTLNPADSASSDALRVRHPRAFALARRERPSVRQLVTAIRDAGLINS